MLGHKKEIHAREIVEEDEDEGEEGEWVILMGMGMLKLGVVLAEL